MSDMDTDEITTERLHQRLCADLAYERAFAMEQTPEVTALEDRLAELRRDKYEWDGTWWRYRKLVSP